MSFIALYLLINKENVGLGRCDNYQSIQEGAGPAPLPPPDYGPEKTASSMSSRLREYLKERCIS